MEQHNPYLGQEEVPLFAPTSDEKTMAILAHVLTLAVGFIAPLVIYLLKKDESTYVTAHAKESLNFQITLFIVVIILVVTVIGVLLLWVVGIFALVLVIVATIKANDGKLYKYPLNIRLIK
jgi:uncharacterized Tic20 family protein